MTGQSLHTPNTVNGQQGQDKDTAFYADIPDDTSLNAWMNTLEDEGDSEWIVDNTLVSLAPKEVAVDCWIWIYKQMKSEWVFKGLYRQGVYKVLHSRLSIFKRYGRNGKSILFIRDKRHTIEEVTVSQILDDIRAYIEENQEPLSVRHDRWSYLEASFEARQEKFNQQAHLIFNDKGLLHLPAHKLPLLKDTPTEAYYPYRNGIVKVTAERIELVSYELLQDRCIWKSQVRNRDFTCNIDFRDAHFNLFVWNISADDLERVRSLMTAIGYALHGHNDLSRSQAVLFYDEEVTGSKEPQGGTGKGLILQALKWIVSTVIVDGKRHDDRQRFNGQSVNEDTRIFAIDDPRRDFNFESLFSALTEGLVVEKKGKDEFRFDSEDSPKIVIASNTILNNEGSSNKRRQFIVELSPFYKRMIKTGVEQPIKEVHGCTFFSEDWDTTEWAKFDRFMMECVQLYLTHGLFPYQLKNVAANRFRQTAGDDFFEWVTEFDNGKGLQPDMIYDASALFQQFRQMYGVGDKDMQQRGFTDRLKKYALSRQWVLKRRPGNSNADIWFEPAQRD